MKRYVLLLYAIVAIGQMALARNQHCAIIDTTAREEELYKPLTEILATAGYNVTYMGIDRVMDALPKTLHLARYDTIFFLLGSEFFCGLPHSHVSRKILTLLAQYSVLRGKTIGLFLPSLRAHPGMNVVSCFAQAFGAMGLHTPMGEISDPFFKAVNTFLSMPLEMRPLGYHTTLNPPHFPFGEAEKLLSHYYSNQSGHDPLCLPINHDCCPEVQATLPYGVYWYNPARKHHIFISTITLASFSGISESFHVCPVRFDLRYQMHEMLLQMMWELHQRCAGKPIKDLERPDLPEFLQKFGDPLDHKTLDQTLYQGRKIAWMELELFEDKDYTETKLDKKAIEQEKADRTKRRGRLIEYIIASGLDTLWISMSPNTYYSSIARNKEQNKKNTWRKEQQFL